MCKKLGITVRTIMVQITQKYTFPYFIVGDKNSSRDQYYRHLSPQMRPKKVTTTHRETWIIGPIQRHLVDKGFGPILRDSLTLSPTRRFHPSRSMGLEGVVEDVFVHVCTQTLVLDSRPVELSQQNWQCMSLHILYETL